MRVLLSGCVRVSSVDCLLVTVCITTTSEEGSAVDELQQSVAEV